MAWVDLLFRVVLVILNLIQWTVLVWVIVSWLVFFASQTSFRWRYKGLYNIMNQLNDILGRMAYPFLKPFRRLLRRWDTRGIDWSPMLLWLAVWILSEIVVTARGAILFR